jgi:signal transduction histidine kinase
MAEAQHGNADASDRGTRRSALVTSLMVLIVSGVLVSLVLAYIDARRQGVGLSEGAGGVDLGFLIAFWVFPIVGSILATRVPGNRIGWILLAIGVAFSVSSLLQSYAFYAAHGGFGGRTSGGVAAALNGPMWIPIVAMSATFLILLFPDGHLPSPRWRWFAWTIGVALTTIFVLIVFAPGPLDVEGFPRTDNPLGVEALRPVIDGFSVLLVFLPIGVIGSLAGLVVRFRRSTGTLRIQLRWLVTTMVGVAGLYALLIVVSTISGDNADSPSGILGVLEAVAILSFALIPISIGVAILKHRLYDIDVVINKTLLYGGLAVLVTGTYFTVVVGVGTLAGSRSSPLLSALAAGVVAVVFQPLRRRAQRVADLMVYGKRATPYEVLADLSDRLGAAYSNDELLPRMARALAQGTGAERADVWIKSGEHFRPAARWPVDVEPPDSIEAVAEARVSRTEIVEPVRHRQEVLGALSIRKTPGEALRPTEVKLVKDLAGQAGLVIRNAMLTEDLLDNIEQLRGSRQRLVHAQDEERRKLERNLHDGAQQQLVALAVQLRLAEQMTERDPSKAKQLLGGLQAATTQALEDLRDLARGIYPPLLADKGLVAALEAQARKGSVPTEVVADGVGRYSEDVESTVYFCALEAMNNVAKYSGASAARLSLAQRNGSLTFELSDDGVGFDPAAHGSGTGLRGMADRLDSVGGIFEVRSSPGGGTSVVGRIPVSID